MNDKMTTAAELLRAWVARQLPETSMRWLEGNLAELQASPTDRLLYLSISLVPRKLGKEDLRLAKADLAAAEDCRPGWRPSGWSVDQAARLALLLSADHSPDRFASRLEQLFVTADVGELVTFYRGLPLYPEQWRYVRRASEGVRTNMKAVFEAVAHNNPYPEEQFDQGAWNQMVLKALFIGSSLKPVVGVDRRSNAELMRMLCDYADERWSAGRAVSPELWRCVGPYADERALRALERVLGQGDDRERMAAALALHACPRAEAAEMLGHVPELAERVRRGDLAWDAIG